MGLYRINFDHSNALTGGLIDFKDERHKEQENELGY